MRLLSYILHNRAAQLVALLCAGALQTLSLAPYNYWILGILSILLVLVFSHALPESKSLEAKKGALFGWAFGFGLFGSGASWVYVSIHVYGYAPPLLAGFLTLLFVAGLALFYALSFYLFFRFKTSNLISNGLLFSAIWILGDGFRTVFLTGFPWLFLGYSHLESPLSGWTPIIGVYGLTLITVMTAVTIYLLFSKTITRNKVVLTVPVVLVWICAPFLSQAEWTQEEPGKEKTVALLQLNIPQELKWQPAQRRKTLRLLDELSNQHWQKDIIVWPETAVPILLDQAARYLDHMGSEAIKNDTSIISGIPFRQFNDDNTQTLHNSIISFGKGNGIYHKQKLVPFGEYVPLQEILRGLIAFFDLPMSDFRRGPSEQPLLRADDILISPFICYEVVYPDFVNRRTQNADVLLTISNDSWFGTSIGPLQHLQMAQMRAAEQGRYMIRATNNGVSAIIDHKGRIVDESEQFVRTSLSSKVKVFSGRTPFSYFGSYPVFVLSLVTCIFLFIRHRKAV